MLLKTTGIIKNIILCYHQGKLSIKFIKKEQEKNIPLKSSLQVRKCRTGKRPRIERNSGSCGLKPSRNRQMKRGEFTGRIFNRRKGLKHYISPKHL
ncbi:predicted protein [Methanosarcina acetivorans C2A]|uniref:Uncharacterized protein n=1 Tax=Methanosarcina acetivorans (strain ATCC 35395 / DSM 2834 / JCM 12185 / C2A) TaxID=188937 RepID=Q8TT15_METAC|nr:predicted protein [Methanosarcina acetivorans C2A]